MLFAEVMMVQKVPEYEWKCARCGIANSPGSEKCFSCACPANFTIGNIQAAKKAGDDLPSSQEGKHDGSGWLIFFPEAIPALLIAAITPFRAIDFLIGGHALRGIFLIVVEVAGLFGFLRAVQAREKWLAYAVMIGLMIGAAALGTVDS
ncbi:MAG TPA: zinc finger Ran-binding domain-containing protein [Burkholderiaceae bacterium]|jgi:hypothetical protein